MLKRLVLHIGRHKSGTSSIQRYLAQNRDRLAAQGVLFPRTAARNRIAHHQLATALHPGLSDGAELPAMLDGLREELAAGYETLLLSSEAFQNIAPADRLKTLLAALPAERVLVVCYVREHLDYALSAYRQMVQAQTRYMTFPAYLERFGDMTGFVERWRGIGELRMKWFDRARFEGGDLIADFCAAAGLSDMPPATEERNPSIGGNLLYLKLLANARGKPFAEYRTLETLAAGHAAFSAPFRVPRSVAADWRAASAYNPSLAVWLGPPGLRDWNGCPDLPVQESLAADIAVIATADPGRTGWLREDLAGAPLPDLVWGPGGSPVAV